MLITVVTPRSADPVSLSLFKAHARIDHDDEDTIIQQYLDSAYETVEQECGICISPTTYLLKVPGCGRELTIPKPPISSITWVKYYDTSNVLQTLDTSKYFLATSSKVSSVLHFTETLSVYDRADALQVQFVAGAASPRKLILQALLMTALENYEHRAPEDFEKPYSQGLCRLFNRIRSWGYR